MMRITSVVLAAALAGCGYSAGTKVEQSQLQQFEVGQTTYSEVVAALGPPGQTSLSADGSRMAVYSYSSMRMRPETYIPFAGAFIGGADTEQSSAIFQFDADGVLTDYRASQGGSGVNTGVIQ